MELHGKEYVVCYQMYRGLYTNYLCWDTDELYKMSYSLLSWVDLKDGVSERLSKKVIDKHFDKLVNKVANLKVDGDRYLLTDLFCYNKIRMLRGKVVYTRPYGAWRVQYMQVAGVTHDIESMKDGLYIDNCRCVEFGSAPIEYLRLVRLSVKRGNQLVIRAGEKLKAKSGVLLAEFTLMRGYSGYGSYTEGVWSSSRYNDYPEDPSVVKDAHNNNLVKDLSHVFHIDDSANVEVTSDYGDKNVDNHPFVICFDLNTGSIIDMCVCESNIWHYNLRGIQEKGIAEGLT